MILDQYLFWVYSIFLLNVIVFTVLINTVLLRMIRTLGMRENEGAVRWTAQKKPSIGGLGFYLVFLISAACYSFFFDPENLFKSIQAIGLFGFCTIAFLMGLADDAYNTKPWLKFFVQFSAGVGCIITDNYIEISDSEAINYTLTILWVVGIMNSINMLDNMDAITASVSIFICLNFLIYMNQHSESDSFEFFITLGVLGSLLGFLFHNWNPSRMYMGDTGSQFLGFFLAAMCIRLLWNSEGTDGSSHGTRQVTLVAMTFLLPLIDTTTVTINRLMKGQSPFVGGKDHTTHHLSYFGLSDSQVAMVFIGLSGICLLGNILITEFLNDWNLYYFFGFIGFMLICFIALFTLTKTQRHHE